MTEYQHQKWKRRHIPRVDDTAPVRRRKPTGWLFPVCLMLLILIAVFGGMK